MLSHLACSRMQKFFKCVLLTAKSGETERGDYWSQLNQLVENHPHWCSKTFTTHMAYEVGLVEFPAFAHEAISHFVPAYRALDKRMHNSRWLNGGVLILSKSLGSSIKAAITEMLFFSPLFVCRYWSRKVIWEAWWIECLDCSTTRPHSRERPEIIY